MSPLVFCDEKISGRERKREREKEIEKK